MSDFDYEKVLSELVNDTENEGRKLTLQDQCEAFACLKANLKTKYVCKAFGISTTAASHIATCLTSTRYRRVKDEYDRRGAEGFQRHYLTPALLLRMRQIKYDIDLAPRDRTKPTPKANRKSFHQMGAFEMDSGQWWRVSWLGWDATPEQNGWYFSPCTPDGEKPLGGWNWCGRESIVPGIVTGDEPRLPFRTSGLAFAGAYAYCQRKPPK